jgi:hypothetical protein
VKTFIPFCLLLSLYLVGDAQDNLFWIGGSGSWNNPENWSLESGGSPANVVPHEINNVYFDENSFNGSSGTVTLDDTWGTIGFCNSMYWILPEGIEPTFQGNTNTSLNIFGSMILSENLIYWFSGILVFSESLETLSGTDTIQTAGNMMLNNINFDGIDASWILMDNLTTNTLGQLNLIHGDLNTNGKTINCKSIFSNSQNSRTLNIQNSTIHLHGDDETVWLVDGTNLNLLADNTQIFVDGISSTFTTINGAEQEYDQIILAGFGDTLVNYNNAVYYKSLKLNGNFSAAMGGFFCDSVFINGLNCLVKESTHINYISIEGIEALIEGNTEIEKLVSNKKVVFLGANHLAYTKLLNHAFFLNDNTFDTLILYPGDGNIFHFQGEKTQTINDSLYIRGHPCSNITLISTPPGEIAYLKKDYGDFDVSCDFINITGVGAVSETLDFYAGDNSFIIPDISPGWTPGNSSEYLFGFGNDTIEACIGDTIIISASDFNGNEDTEYYWNESSTPGEPYYLAHETEEITLRVKYFEDCNLLDFLYIQFDSCAMDIPEKMVDFNFNIFPNPSNGNFNLEINTQLDAAELSIFDTKGIMVYNEKIQAPEFFAQKRYKLSYLPKGIYFLRFTFGNKTTSRKIMLK